MGDRGYDNPGKPSRLWAQWVKWIHELLSNEQPYVIKPHVCVQRSPGGRANQ